MAGNSIAEDIDSSFTAVPAISQDLLPSQEADDIFLTIQRDTFAVSKIYVVKRKLGQCNTGSLIVKGEVLM